MSTQRLEPVLWQQNKKKAAAQLLVDNRLSVFFPAGVEPIARNYETAITSKNAEVLSLFGCTERTSGTLYGYPLPI